jgi:hypothetical protein
MGAQVRLNPKLTYIFEKGYRVHSSFWLAAGRMRSTLKTVAPETAALSSSGLPVSYSRYIKL